jgi:type VI protein secretion system component Hcp
MFKEAVIQLCRADGSKAKFMEIRLSQVRLTMHSISGGPQGDVRTPYESLSLSFEKIEWFYYPGAFELKAEPEVRAGWSSQTAAATA